MAAFNIRLEVVQVLLEHNADINSQDIDGDTPLNRNLIDCHSPPTPIFVSMTTQLRYMKHRTVGRSRSLDYSITQLRSEGR
jgi:hypothetical protein